MFKSDMADEFQGGICGGNLWNGSTDFFGSSTCSISSWPYNQESFVADIKASSSSRSSDDSTASDGNILQDAENTQQPMSTYHEWHQDLIFDNEQSEGNYSYIVPQDSTCAINSSMMNYWQQISLVNCPQTVHKTCQSTSTTDPNFLANSNPYSHTSSSSRSLFEADSLQQQHQHSLLENNPEMSYLSGILRTRDESPIAKPSYSKPSSTQPQFLPPSHRSKTRAHLHSLSAKNEEPRDFGSAVKKAGNESAGTKRARVETPSPLPTFKVRKEKLGDRVTALQQLVSPFGKTDTASVLHEAIEYIKFLHDQVSALSAPYLKNGSPRLKHHRQVNDQVADDLKSRGLCLVPISSTFPIAAETTADLWTPTLFGQSFR